MPAQRDQQADTKGKAGGRQRGQGYNHPCWETPKLHGNILDPCSASKGRKTASLLRWRELGAAEGVCE